MNVRPLRLLAVVSGCVAALSGMAGASSSPFAAAEADVWVLAGQSNMQGWALITKDYAPNPNVVVFDLQNNWVPAVPPTHRVYTAAAPVFKKLIFEMNPTLTTEVWARLENDDRKKPLGGLGPDIAFAESIVAATGRKVILLPCALGGTSLAHWNPGRKGEGIDSLYGNMLDRIARVGGKIKGVLWYQGEAQSGSRESAEYFEQDFLRFVDAVRRDVGQPELPFLFVQIGRFANAKKDTEPHWKVVQEAQRRCVSKRRHVWMVPAVDLPLDDLIHVGESGQARLGRRLAEVALTHVYDRGGHGTAIDLQSVEVLSPPDAFHHVLRVKFNGVTGRLGGAGRLAGFTLDSDDPAHDGPMVYKVEQDPADPAAVLVWYSKALTQPVRLSYALGFDVYANLTDERDMAVPAFGPVVVEPRK